MSINSHNVPPSLNDDSEYESWKRDIDIWSRLTSLPATKMALAIHLSLKGKARSASSELTVAELSADDGVKKLIAKLDGIFLQDKGSRQFASFRELYNLRREDGVKFEDFISNFEHTYFKFKNNDMVLPDSVIAFMLLAASNLTEKDAKLVMSAVPDVKYDAMKAAIKRIFGGTVKDSCNPDMKIEPVFEAAEVYYSNSYGHRGWGSKQNYGKTNRGSHFRGQGRGHHRGFVSGSSRGGRRLNPVDREGNVSKCRICDSKFHWASKCPDAFENIKESNLVSDNKEPFGHTFETGDDSAIVHLSLFIGYTDGDKKNNDSKLDQLVKDSSCSALLDSGCSKTVCGQKWLDSYIGTLSDFDRGCIREKPSDSSFTFGDSSREKSIKRVILPCYIGSRRSEIECDVVKCNIPLLLGKPSMQKGKMCLNFANDTLFVAGESVNLKCSSSGHYLLPLHM